jgi:hypothetical protein
MNAHKNNLFMNNPPRKGALKKERSLKSPQPGGDLEGATMLLGRATFVLSLNLMTNAAGAEHCRARVKLFIKQGI